MSTSPLYDLAKVTSAAAARNVATLRKVQMDMQTLGYSHAEMCDCLSKLKLSDFKKTIEYEGEKYDVYGPRYTGSSGAVDELYVKLGFGRQTVPQVFLRSFHLSR